MAPATRASTKRRAAGSDAAKAMGGEDSFDTPTDAEVSLDEDVKHAQVSSTRVRMKRPAMTTTRRTDRGKNASRTLAPPTWSMDRNPPGSAWCLARGTCLGRPRDQASAVCGATAQIALAVAQTTRHPGTRHGSTVGADIAPIPPLQRGRSTTTSCSRPSRCTSTFLPPILPLSLPRLRRRR